jgi:GT2 family glycosyltransferase
MPEVTAVLVNHNGARTIAGAIRSVLGQTHPAARILVVDNASTDGSAEQVRAGFPGVELIELRRNEGPGRARNLGLSLAGTDLLLWLDDDMILAPDCLENLLAAHQETRAAAVCPRILFYPEKDRIQFDGAALHFCGVLSLVHANQPAALEPQRTFPNAFGSACLLVDRAALAGLGGFDEDIFFYFEDLELSYRLRSQGHVICCEANAAAWHDLGRGEAELAFRGRGRYPARRAYYLLRHRWMILLLHYQARTLWLLSPALALYELASFASALGRGWLWQWGRALFSAAAHGGRLLARRRQLQRVRRVPDRELLSGGPLPFSAGFVRGGAEAALAGLLDRLLDRYWQRVKAWL